MLRAVECSIYYNQIDDDVQTLIYDSYAFNLFSTSHFGLNCLEMEVIWIKLVLVDWIRVMTVLGSFCRDVFMTSILQFISGCSAVWGDGSAVVHWTKVINIIVLRTIYCQWNCGHQSIHFRILHNDEYVNLAEDNCPALAISFSNQGGLCYWMSLCETLWFMLLLLKL